MRDLIELLESHEWLLLESPQRADWIIKNMGPKLEARYQSDVQANLVPQIIQSQVEAEEPEDPVAKLVSYIMQHDPSNGKGYARWIASVYIKGHARFEDINRSLSNNLATFQRASQAKRITLPPAPEGTKPKDPNNIDSYKSFADLSEIVHPFNTGEREVSGRQDRVAGRVTKVDTRVQKMWENDPMLAQTNVLLDDDDYMVLSPKTFDAAKHFGENTSWCTTTQHMYDHYTQGEKGSPLYIILDRKANKRYQFHMDNRWPQFKDEHDAGIDINEFLDKHPKVFQAIGPNTFAPMIGFKDEKGQPLSLRHFSPETIAVQSPETISRAVASVADLQALPAEAINGNLFQSLMPRMNPANGSSKNRYAASTGVIDEENARSMIKYFTQKLRDPQLFINEVRRNGWLLRLLPPHLQTDEAKQIVAENETWHNFEHMIPKPWPENITKEFWDSRCDDDSYLTPDHVPEKYATDQNMACVLGTHPEFIKKYLDRLKAPGFVKAMFEHIKSIPHRVEELVRNLPEEYQSKELHDLIYNEARQHTGKAGEDERDAYLETLSLFKHDHWPWKAPKAIDRIATLNKTFKGNPNSYHNIEFAEKWVVQHPFKLHELDKEHVTAAIVKAAINATSREGKLSTNGIKNVLDKCNPKIVTQAFVTAALDGFGDLSNCWEGIPEKYLTEQTIDVLLSKGDIPFDDKRFPANKFTPSNILARFTRSVALFKHELDTRGQPAYDWQGKKKQSVNIEGLKEAWDQLPSQVDHRAVLLTLIPKFVAIVAAVPEKMLNDSDVLTTWLRVVSRSFQYTERNRLFDVKELFKRFPKSAYTSENMAMAVENGIIDEVPDDLHDDDVLVNMINNYGSRSKVDWSKITPGVFIKAIDKDPYHSVSNLEYNVPDDSPLLKSEDVAFAALASKAKKNNSYVLTPNDKSFREIFGPEHPDRRAHWTQRCYDLSAGSVVPLTDIPKKFWSATVLKRAVSTDPESIVHVPDAAKWLNKAGSFSSAVMARMMSRGFVHTDAGWIDANSAKHETVPGAKGSYAVVKVAPKGNAILIFDAEGKCVDSLMFNVAHGESNDWSQKLFSSTAGRSHEDRHDPNPSLLPYRLLIADALEKHPNLSRDLKSRHGGDEMAKFLIFDDGGNYKLVEKMDRTSVDGSDLTFVKPSMRGYQHGGENYFLFNGQGPMIGRVVLSSSGRGNALETCKLKGSPELLMSLSGGMAQFLADERVASGKNPKFLASDFFKYGVRGPGNGEWYTLLQDQVFEAGGFKAWRAGNRITVTNDSGVVSTGKKAKDGGFLPVETFDKDAPKLEAFYVAMKGKI